LHFLQKVFFPFGTFTCAREQRGGGSGGTAWRISDQALKPWAAVRATRAGQPQAHAHACTAAAPAAQPTRGSTPFLLPPPRGKTPRDSKRANSARAFWTKAPPPPSPPPSIDPCAARAKNDLRPPPSTRSGSSNGVRTDVPAGAPPVPLPAAATDSKGRTFDAHADAPTRPPVPPRPGALPLAVRAPRGAVARAPGGAGAARGCGAPGCVRGKLHPSHTPFLGCSLARARCARRAAARRRAKRAPSALRCHVAPPVTHRARASRACASQQRPRAASGVALTQHACLARAASARLAGAPDRAAGGGGRRGRAHRRRRGCVVVVRAA
jgi:hypothetical protein